MKKAVMIIANQDYQDNEYNIPKDLLEDAGVEVVTGYLIEPLAIGC